MRAYKIPFEFEHEEKLGGYFSFRQLIYLVLIFVCFALLFTSMPVVLKLIIFVCAVSFLSACAFVKVVGQYFDRFIFTFVSFMFRDKKMYFKR
ncbi:MAG: hypothetical protein ACFWT2_12275 [Thermoanaerobacterium thermosaccharolyticum]